MGLYFHGEFGEADRWFAESAALAPASGQWLVAGSSLAYRSLIAGERGRLEEQRLLAEQATELVRERGIGDVDGEAPLALGVSLAARGRPEDALPLIGHAIAVLRSWGQPIDLANALLRQASVLRILGESDSSAAAMAEARSILESCPDPGILTDRLNASARSPRTSRPRSGGQEPDAAGALGCSACCTAICPSGISAVSTCGPRHGPQPRPGDLPQARVRAGRCPRTWP
jgi:tetratricopeptide (TPR) repeat protein